MSINPIGSIYPIGKIGQEGFLRHCHDRYLKLAVSLGKEGWDGRLLVVEGRSADLGGGGLVLGVGTDVFGFGAGLEGEVVGQHGGVYAVYVLVYLGILMVGADLGGVTVGGVGLDVGAGSSRVYALGSADTQRFGTGMILVRRLPLFVVYHVAYLALVRQQEESAVQDRQVNILRLVSSHSVAVVYFGVDVMQHDVHVEHQGRQVDESLVGLLLVRTLGSFYLLDEGVDGTLVQQMAREFSVHLEEEVDEIL